MSRQKATSRDPEEWARATEAARAARRAAAAETAAAIADGVFDLIVAGDVMGGRAMFAQRLAVIAKAEQRGDELALRAAVLDGAVALGAWVAALDFRAPSELNGAG